MLFSKVHRILNRNEYKKSEMEMIIKAINPIFNNKNINEANLTHNLPQELIDKYSIFGVDKCNNFYIKTDEGKCLILIPRENVMKILDSLYNNPLFLRKSPLAFYVLVKQFFIGITVADVTKYMMKQESYQRQKKQRITIPISNKLISKPLERLQMDLTQVKKWEVFHTSIKYIFVIIDVYSRYVWTFLLTSKKSSTILKTLKNFIFELESVLKKKPSSIQSDQGIKFLF